MAVWLVRAGAHGQFEEKFLSEGRIYLTWGKLAVDLSKLDERGQFKAALEEIMPDASKGKLNNNVGQIWAFVKSMQVGDWVVLPSKLKSAINIGKVTGDYQSAKNAEAPFFHYRAVDWFATDIPRSNFDQDILYSLGAFLTVCRIKRNDAEKRLHQMADNDWQSQKAKPDLTLVDAADDDIDDDNASPDLEQVARDQIAKVIAARFSGHELTRLVDAILTAQGYETFRSPAGPDKGIDILAAPAPMGFGEPRICVQVKSGDTPLDRPTLDQLIGTMQNVQASHGLLVSWGGFKRSVNQEVANQFFRVRLWDQDEVIDQILTHYDHLDGSIKEELLLKRVWIVSNTGED